MPDPFRKAKMTGDTHPPEFESDLPQEEGSSDAAGLGGESRDRGEATKEGREAQPGRGARKAGVVQDQDGPTRQGNASDPASGGHRT